MIDIVERLRCVGEDRDDTLLEDAADEIESLRLAIKVEQATQKQLSELVRKAMRLLDETQEAN